MLSKEFKLNHSLTELKNALTKISINNKTQYVKLEFQDSFNLIKIVGNIFLGSIVTIEITYEVLSEKSINVKITYTGTGAKKEITEQNENSFDRDFSKLLIKYLTGDVNKSGIAELEKKSGIGCGSIILIVLAITLILSGLSALLSL
ncbi:MAG: hypothetical protein IPN93_10270 [Bacteroidetes bacterium]|nr:hypothetical protein [Bacteroidota bacterium]MBL0078509.1 hypothetical protein [Bacteroidota bacterium]MBL0288754.1 hypothetical protein [Bacteroidota bacterium]